MSEVALSNVAELPKSERINGSSHFGTSIETQVKGKENIDEGQKKDITPTVGTPVKIDKAEKTESVLVTSEVEYIESKDLKDVDDVDSCLKTLILDLSSKDWVLLCNALNNVRRLSICHKDAIVSLLSEVISLVVKSVKNPRSAVCKTAIMTCADIFKAYGDGIIELLDPLLVPLLLKSSQDKKFVCEAAESALIALTSSVSPLLLLSKLQLYINDRNPRIRAKASMCISRSVPRLGVDEVESFGIVKLIQIGVSQLNDRLPESRDAARTLLLELQAAYEKFHANVTEPTPLEDHDAIATPSWEQFCESKLPPLSAQAVLRVTNVPPQVGPLLGSYHAS